MRLFSRIPGTRIPYGVRGPFGLALSALARESANRTRRIYRRNRMPRWIAILWLLFSLAVSFAIGHF